MRFEDWNAFENLTALVSVGVFLAAMTLAITWPVAPLAEAPVNVVVDGPTVVELPLRELIPKKFHLASVRFASEESLAALGDDRHAIAADIQAAVSYDDGKTFAALPPNRHQKPEDGARLRLDEIIPLKESALLRVTFASERDWPHGMRVVVELEYGDKKDIQDVVYNVARVTLIVGMVLLVGLFIGGKKFLRSLRQPDPRLNAHRPDRQRRQ